MRGDKLWCAGCGKYFYDTAICYETRNKGKPNFTGTGAVRLHFIDRCPYCWCDKYLNVNQILIEGLALKNAHQFTTLANWNKRGYYYQFRRDCSELHKQLRKLGVNEK